MMALASARDTRGQAGGCGVNRKLKCDGLSLVTRAAPFPQVLFLTLEVDHGNSHIALRKREHFVS